MTQMNQPGGGQPIPPPQMPPTMPPGYPPPGVYPQQGYGPPPKKGMSGGMIALIVIGALVLVLAIPCGLGMLLMPNLSRAKEMALRAKCSANLRQIGAALVMYSNNNKGDYPESMARLIETSGLSGTVLVCPDTTDTPLVNPGPNLTDAQLIGHCSYIYVGKGWKESTAGADTVLVYEPLADHHGKGINVLYGDYHVEWIDAQAAAESDYTFAVTAAGEGTLTQGNRMWPNWRALLLQRHNTSASRERCPPGAPHAIATGP